MIRMSVKVDIKGLEQQINRIRRDRIPVAMANAINRAADQTATAAGREVSKATKIPVREVRRRISIARASRTRLVADVIMGRYAPNLAKFGRPAQNRRGVAATAWEGRKTYKGAFLNPKTGKVVTRTTDKRLPLKGLIGPSVRSTFMRDDIITRLTAVARQAWRTRIEREVARELRRG